MPAPADKERAFYVLGTYTQPAFILTSSEGPQTLDECRAAIRWQGRGGSPSTDWVIAYWDAETQLFRGRQTGLAIDVHRGPITAEAFDRFMAALPRSS